MAKLISFLTLLAIFLSVLKLTHASVALCVGVTGPSFLGREVVGFQLWNDRGEEAAQYRTILWARKTDMSNNDWYLHLTFAFNSVYLALDTAYLNSTKYGEIGFINLINVCDDSGPSNYYGCIENSNVGFCESNKERYVNYCKTQLSMGSDFKPC